MSINIVSSVIPVQDSYILVHRNEQIRFLLTNDCSASCSYCHNEGQEKGKRVDLSIEDVRYYLEKLKLEGKLPDEIVLSGGEPSLNRDFLAIAKLCKEYVEVLSVDSHGGHYNKLIPSYDYIDELKVHIDSLDAEENLAQMGVNLDNVMRSIDAAKKAGVYVIINHPLQCLEEGVYFASQCEELGFDCKLVQIHLNSTGRRLSELNFPAPYVKEENKWVNSKTGHVIYLKSCDNADNDNSPLYISKATIREGMKED